MKTLLQKIKELEAQGWIYERNYVTVNHILGECLVKEVEDEKDGYKYLIKSIEKGKIIDYIK